jgi:serine/threonine protein kinase
MHPRDFGKYRILKLLPLGGMGRVYLAEDLLGQREVALKLIEHGPDRHSQQIVEAERRGAVLQSRLCEMDSRVTVIHEYGDVDGFFYIEMEYVYGEDLSEILTKGPLGVPFAARIARDICQVLHHAHTFNATIGDQSYHGIVHGDIKPRNIRITPDGAVKVLDFGIAKALSHSRLFTQNQFGSSQYSSPERMHSGDVDVASDLWSVAVVLYEIVTARPYFQDDTLARLEHSIRNYHAVKPLPPELPAAFRAVLHKALHPDPGKRYANAFAFAADLSAFLENKATVAESDAITGDAETTRRTTPPSAESDEARTRRTSAPVAPPKRAPKPRKPLTLRQRQVRLGVQVCVFLFVGWLFYNEYSVWRRGTDLAGDLETGRLTDLDAAWDRYSALARSGLLPALLSSPRNQLKQRLIAGADRVIGEYRSNDAPSVIEADWLRARASLGHALELSPNDKEVRGRILLCEGHVDRINAQSRAQPKLWSEARAKFEEAHELMPRSPDPYLGLARLYVYGVRDIDKAEDALANARKRGHEMGKRERGQLADGYRDRGDRLSREAQRVSGLPEEEDYLKRAQKDYKKAEDLYQDIVPFGGSTASLRRVYQSLDTVGMRLQEIRQSH